MKKVNLFFRCVINKIKKNFFKDERGDISHACAEFQNMDDDSKITVDGRDREEYAQNYNITTRWQTV